jgi:hypothetical protein
MSDEVAKKDLDFRDSKALESWLKRQPREVSVIIAARAALRVLPVGALDLPKPRHTKRMQRLRDLISSLFRAGALAWITAKYPARDTEFAVEVDAAAAAAIARAAVIDSDFSGDVSSAYASAAYAAEAAASAAYAVTGAAPRNAASASAAVARAARSAAAALAVQVDAAVADAWEAVSDDANFLSRGFAVVQLADRRLWPRGTPLWGYELWPKLRVALPAGEDWEVWTKWYQERLDGAPSRGEASDLVFAAVPEEVWDQDPAAANRWIKEHLPPESQPEELPPIESLPTQIAAAAQFSEGGAGPIDLARDPAHNDPTEIEDQREHYAEARQKALDLQSLGGNFLGDDLQRRVSRLLEVLPDDMDTLSIVKLWHRANSLRERLADHDQAALRQGAHGEPDPAILAYAAAGPLRDFVKSYNIFIVGDAKGRELDRKSLGPGERERDEAAIAAMEPVIAALRSAPEVATEAVPEILQELSDAAKSAPKSFAGDQDVALARDSLANFIIAAIHKAHRWSKDETAFMSKEVRAGVYRGLGGVIAAGAVATCWPTAAHFIVERADALKAFATLVYNNPSVSQMIDAIAQHLLRGHV